MYEYVLASKKHITYLKQIYTKYVIWFKNMDARINFETFENQPLFW